ncbi:hypothetical protein ACFORL_01190 [Legionella dresdenensis]|uniref:Ankyrin repeats (3 copies) n=1 Tax=Legionella dresdenensis TaxID=450200 RepID=A0ABV8CBZ1_9GAMM
MTQEEIRKAIESALNAQNFDKARELVFSGTDTPDSSTIDYALVMASDKGADKLIADICQMQGNNRPTQKAVDRALLNVSESTVPPWLFETICDMTGDNKPSKEGISQALERLCEDKNVDGCLGQIEHILFRLNPESNQPGQPAIEKALKKASEIGQWQVVKKLLKSNAENKPGQAAVGEVLLKAVESKQLYVFGAICNMTGENKPSQKNLNDAVDKLLTMNNNSSPWRYVSLLVKAVDRKGTTKLERAVLEQAVQFGFMQAAGAKNIAVVKVFCGLSADIHPNKKAVSDALIAAAKSGGHEVVSFLTTLQNENKPDMETLGNAFTAAARAGKAEVIKCLYPLSELPLDTKLVNEALKNAAQSLNGLEVIKVIYQEENGIFPDDKTKNEVFLQAVAEGESKVVKYLIDHANLEQSVIRQGLSTTNDGPTRAALNDFIMNVAEKNAMANSLALSTAATEGNVDELKKICSEIGTNQLKLADVQNALKVARNDGSKECLQDAEKIIKLQMCVDKLRVHGNKLEKDPARKADGKTAIEYADKLTKETNAYAKAYFTGTPGEGQKAKNAITQTLNEASDKMKHHRSNFGAVLLVLKKIGQAVTVIGAVLSNRENKGFFNTNTQRQNEIAKFKEGFSQMKKDHFDMKGDPDVPKESQKEGHKP